MIVAVTGSSGFIGTNLVKKLRKKNHEVLEIDLNKGYDILNYASVKNIKKFDVCVHLAANSYVPKSFENPHDFYSLNIQGLVNSLELCRVFNAKLVFASSYVYGAPNYLPINENHPLQGFNPYSETKIIGEKIISDYHKYFGIKAIILRPFNIYGLNQNENFLIPSILKQTNDKKIVLQDPRPRRDFVYIDDVVSAFTLAVENQKIEFDTFNVGFGKSYSVKNIFDIINNLLGGKLIVSFSDKIRMNEVLDTVSDITKAKDKLAWTPKIDLTTGILKIINNEKN